MRQGRIVWAEAGGGVEDMGIMSRHRGECVREIKERMNTIRGDKARQSPWVVCPSVRGDELHVQTSNAHYSAVTLLCS